MPSVTFTLECQNSVGACINRSKNSTCEVHPQKWEARVRNGSPFALLVWCRPQNLNPGADVLLFGPSELNAAAILLALRP